MKKKRKIFSILLVIIFLILLIVIFIIIKANKKYTITFNTNGGSKIESIKVSKKQSLKLPSPPKKEGYIFKGWKLSNGKEINEKTKVKNNITITAIWKEEYTCPSDCTINSDLKTCNKIITTNAITKSTCDSNYVLKNGKCLNYSTKYYAENDYGNWKCNNNNDYMYSVEDGVGGAFMWCVPSKSPNKIIECPSGYETENGVCQKTETINCTKN